MGNANCIPLPCISNDHHDYDSEVDDGSEVAGSKEDSFSKMLESSGSKMEDHSSSVMGCGSGQNVSSDKPKTPDSKTYLVAGITNMGNTCYMSSILQCLTHSRHLRNVIQSLKHIHNYDESPFCILGALRDHITENFLPHDGPKPRIIVPTLLSDNLQLIFKDFLPWKQQDVHEFLIVMFGQLDNCEPNLVHQIFGGFFLTRYTCSLCGGGIEEGRVPFNHFSLMIDNFDSIFEPLSSAVCVPSQTEFGKCHICDRIALNKESTLLIKTPEILILHLLRTAWASDGNATKIEKYVKFCSQIDLINFNANLSNKDCYKLYAVVVHIGSDVRSGHYISFVCPEEDWFLVNDEKVKAVSEDYVLSQEAYILFYARREN